MANQEQLDIFKQGVEMWNQWRQEHADVNADLSHVDLRGTNLSGVILNNTRLVGANLRGANLSHAQLIGANLALADLRGADFRNTNLSTANLSSADLIGANLIGANLLLTDFKNANLRSAILSRMHLSLANFSHTDISNTILVETDHSGTSEYTQTWQEGNEMANQEHLEILKQGVEVWNQWRKDYADIRPNLSSANLSGINLYSANLTSIDLHSTDLSSADLSDASLLGANLAGANLSWANLSGANFGWANLSAAYLLNANLVSTSLFSANLSTANLIHANLSNARLERAILVQTNFTDATLTDCKIYGIAAWNVQLEGATQNDLVITPQYDSPITVDNLKVAQFIYLLLNNKEIRDIIDTITSKTVLILGRFTDERKAILDALRNELRKRNYTPILFDFEKPSSRDFTETVTTLAHLARFIIADITEPSSIPQELQAIVPDLKVPVQPLLQESKREYAMFIDFRKYPWVLPIHFYKDQTHLLESLQEKVIDLAEYTVQNYEKQK